MEWMERESVDVFDVAARHRTRSSQRQMPRSATCRPPRLAARRCGSDQRQLAVSESAVPAWAHDRPLQPRSSSSQVRGLNAADQPLFGSSDHNDDAEDPGRLLLVEALVKVWRPSEPPKHFADDTGALGQVCCAARCTYPTWPHLRPANTT